MERSKWKYLSGKAYMKMHGRLGCRTDVYLALVTVGGFEAPFRAYSR